MAKRKSLSGRNERKKDRLRKRQKRQQSANPIVQTNNQVDGSDISCKEVNGAVSAPFSNFPGYGSEVSV